MPTAPDRHYFLSADFLSHFTEDLPVELIDQDSEFAIIKLRQSYLPNLSHLTHTLTGFCGGFVDVENYFQAGNRTLAQILATRPSAPPPPLPPVPMQPRASVTKILRSLSAERLKSRALWLANGFPNRHFQFREGLAASCALKAALEEISNGRCKVEEIPLLGIGSQRLQQSVIATIPGEDQSLPGALIGAHLDTHIDSIHSGGVDDDASGVATVLETFSSLLSTRLLFKRNIYFALYAAEEAGMLGSLAVADRFKHQAISLRGVMQLDMTAFKRRDDQALLYFFEPFTNSLLTNFTRQLAITYLGIRSTDLSSTSCGNLCNSDHWSWHMAGYPTVFPFEASRGNPGIHSDLDVADGLDWTHALKFLALAVAFAVELSEPPGDVLNVRARSKGSGNTRR